MSKARRRFLPDASAQSAAEFTAIALVVVVPLALFLALLLYLRRTIGTPPPQEEVSPRPPPEGAESKVAGSRKCRRCGVEVRPTRGPMGIECPNCGAGMA